MSPTLATFSSDPIGTNSIGHGNNLLSKLGCNSMVVGLNLSEVNGINSRRSLKGVAIS